MKRKLINFDVFESIQRNSLSYAEKELVEAAPVLGKALGVEGLSLLSFDKETAMYEAIDGNFLHASYKISPSTNKVAFENITQVSIDQDSEKEKAKENVSLLVDALLENKIEEAEVHFDKYVALPYTRRRLQEAFIPFMKEKDKDKKAKSSKPDDDCKEGSKEKSKKKHKGKKSGKSMAFAKKAGTKTMKEWSSLANNVFNYVDYKKIGPVLAESQVVRDGRDIVALTIPTSEGRTVSKMLKLNYKNVDQELKVVRGKAKTVSESQAFCKAVADLKRNNAISDNAALEESIEKIIGQFPEVLFLTQEELADHIKVALEATNATNYDDNTCAFMAEGILRGAYNIYTDKVQRIVALSGAKVDEAASDGYVEFKNLVDGFYTSLDESAQKEMQLFVDLYEALRSVYDIAAEQNDSVIQTETATHLNELLAILRQQTQPDITIAEDAAGWLDYLIESGLQAWTVTSNASITINGDVPGLAAKAKVPGNPASQEDEYGPGAASNGKGKDDAERAAQQSAWTGAGADKDIWPGLNNPYIPKPYGDFTMAGEKGVDKDGDTTFDPQDSNTWPELQNPYIPKPDNSVFKMKADDLVVDK